MGLREQIENDLEFIIEDKDSGFGWDINITDPSGTSKDLVGFSNDISQVIDPDTGEAVSGRSASVALRISTLITLGFLDLPEGIADASKKPWVVKFDDIQGSSYTFKVMKSNPDRGIGTVTLILESYKE